MNIDEYTNDLLGAPLSFDYSSSPDVTHYLVKIEDNSGATVVDWTTINTNIYQHTSSLGMTECSSAMLYKIKAVDHAGLESSEVSTSHFRYDVSVPGGVSSVLNLNNTEVNRSEEHSLSVASDNCGADLTYEIAVSTSTLESYLLFGWEYTEKFLLTEEYQLRTL